MASISTQFLKQNLSEILRRAAKGEWITVLRHGRAVARLGPAVEPGLHVGSRYDTDIEIRPIGRRLTKGAYTGPTTCRGIRSRARC